MNIASDNIAITFHFAAPNVGNSHLISFNSALIVKPSLFLQQIYRFAAAAQARLLHTHTTPQLMMMEVDTLRVNPQQTRRTHPAPAIVDDTHAGSGIEGCTADACQQHSVIIMRDVIPARRFTFSPQARLQPRPQELPGIWCLAQGHYSRLDLG